ncbi:MAG: pentapeptide repeat-containing protein [Chloroflexota bacterium]|nr:pentapeptide repeat-containing protein [Chloroflexota bacterium]
MVSKRKHLVERWSRQEWRGRYRQLLACWQARRELGQLSLPQHAGRWDLRGINLEIESPVPGNIELPNGLVVDFVRGPRPIFKGVQFCDVDFSYANLGRAVFEGCSFSNVLLREANGSGVNDQGSTFQDVDLFKADWRNATLGLDGARYEQVSFQRTDLRRVHCYRGYFVDCDFSNARLEHVDFQVSHFVRCKFKGKLKRVWFRGYYALPNHEKTYGKTEFNLMKDIDFSEAELWDVVFTNNCDLSQVIPPQDGKHVLFRDWPGTLVEAWQEVEQKWEGVFREEAVRHLDNLGVHENPMRILNLDFEASLVRKGFPEPDRSEEFVQAFIDLLLRSRV